MSQAHYTTCRSADWRGECGAPAVALVHLDAGIVCPRCVECLNSLLDFRDAVLLPDQLKIDWVWDAGTRTCPIHHWPAVLCEGWNDEHHLVKRGTESYSDLARRLISLRSTT